MQQATSSMVSCEMRIRVFTVGVGIGHCEDCHWSLGMVIGYLVIWLLSYLVVELFGC